MARIPEFRSKTDLPEERHAIFDAIAESRGAVGFPFSLLLNSPEAAGRIAHLGAYLRFESVLPPVDREIAILTAARESDCEFEWAAHTRLGEKAGVRPEVIDVIGHRRSIDLLRPEEALIVRYGQELLRQHRVTDATFQAALASYGNQGIVELTALVGYYFMIACVLNAFEAKPRSVSADLP